MRAGVYNMWVEQGATFRLSMEWTNDLDEPIDLTGMTARMMARTSKTSTTPIVTLTTENGGITLGGVAGTIDIDIDPVTTAALVSGSYVYDLEIVNGPEVTRLIEGTFTVDGEVTKP